MNFLAVNPGFYIFGKHIAWYGVIIACGMALAIVLCVLLAKKRNLKGDNFISAALWAIPLAIIGARLVYVLFNTAGHSYTFVEALRIWDGGMSIWGGVIFGTIGVLINSLITKKNFLDFCDVIAPGLILAQSMGRWGNYLNQEAYGWTVTNPNLQWFPFSVFIEADGAWHLATFFYEGMLNLGGFVLLLLLLLKTKKRGLIVSIYLMFYGTVRAVIETFRTDPLLIAGTSFRVSQALSILSAVIGLGLLIYIIIRDKKLRLKNKS